MLSLNGRFVSIPDWFSFSCGRYMYIGILILVHSIISHERILPESSTQFENLDIHRKIKCSFEWSSNHVLQIS